MNLSITRNELYDYVSHQLSFFYPDGLAVQSTGFRSAFELALERTEFCLSKIRGGGGIDNQGNGFRAYKDANNEVCFNHLHGDMYATFLWFLCNSLWTITQNKPLCDKLVLLNKALHGIMATYKCGLPDIFLFSHPQGSVLGTAEYSNYLVVLQNVTVSAALPANGEMIPVRLGEYVWLGANSSIIASQLGRGSSLDIGVTVRKMLVPPNSVVEIKEGRTSIRTKKGISSSEKVFLP